MYSVSGANKKILTESDYEQLFVVLFYGGGLENTNPFLLPFWKDHKEVVVIAKVQKKDVDWNVIRADYIATRSSYTDLANKYNLNRTTVSRKAGEEGWVQLREQHEASALSKAVKEIEKNQTKRMTKLFDLTDKVMNTLLDAIGEKGGEKAKVLILSDPKKITGAIKDLKEIYMFRSSRDLEEQEARINKLRKDVEVADDNSIGVEVTFKTEDEQEEWAK